MSTPKYEPVAMTFPLMQGSTSPSKNRLFAHGLSKSGSRHVTFSRTSAMADIWVPLRAGSDILFLGGLINYVLKNDRIFREYVVHYTNAPTILRDEVRDTEDLAGLFSGWDAEKKKYDPESWLYESAPSKDKASGHGQAE